MQFGYLDPASGSLVASVLVGGTAAVGVAVRSMRSRISGAWRKDPAGDGTGEETTTETDADDVDA